MTTDDWKSTDRRLGATEPRTGYGWEGKPALVLVPEPGLIGVVGLKITEVPDGGGQAGTVQKMAGEMLVADPKAFLYYLAK